MGPAQLWSQAEGPQTCTTGRHPGEERREVLQYSCHRTAASRRCPAASLKGYFKVLLAYRSGGGENIAEVDITLSSVNPLSFQLPSFALIVRLSQAYTERCLWSRNWPV